MGHQPFRATFDERTAKTLADGRVRAGACRAASGGCFVRERLACSSRSGTPKADEGPTGFAARGAATEGHVSRRRQGDARGCRAPVQISDRLTSLSPPTGARRAMPPRRTGSSRGERRSEVRQPVQNPARTGR